MIKKGVVDGGKGGKERNNLVVGEKEKKLQEPGYTGTTDLYTFVELRVVFGTCFKINISGCF